MMVTTLLGKRARAHGLYERFQGEGVIVAVADASTFLIQRDDGHLIRVSWHEIEVTEPHREEEKALRKRISELFGGPRPALVWLEPPLQTCMGYRACAQLSGMRVEVFEHRDPVQARLGGLRYVIEAIETGKASPACFDQPRYP